MPMGPTPEENSEAEGEEMLAYYLSQNPDVVISPEDLREAGPEIAQFENLITQFESRHDLEALHAITDLTPAEAPNQPIREAAKIDLNPIVALFNTLEAETNISKVKRDELKEKYKILSRAVGMINNNKVDHTR